MSAAFIPTDRLASITKPRASHRASNRAIAGAVALTLSGIITQQSLASASNATWIGTGGDNLWTNAANWSPGNVPNNGTGGFADYNVSIGSPAPCVLQGLNPTIDNLTITASGILDIQYANTLQVNGPTLTDNGSIVINSNTGGLLADLYFGASTAINGSGTISLQYAGNAYLNAPTGVTVTQAAAHSIVGVGDISMGFVNNGTVNANVNGQSLFVLNYNASNNQTFEATNGGSLNLNGIAVTQGAAGVVNASAGSSVVLSNGTNISGGTLVSAGAGFIQISGTDTITGLTNKATLNIPYAQSLNVVGNLVDNGTIVVNSNTGGLTAALNFSGGTLSGTGTVQLQYPSINAQLNGSVTQSAGHSIVGFGQINAVLTNQGLVNANVNGNTLYIESPTVVNTSLMEATNGATLYFDNATVVTNTGGTINASGGSITLANGTSINGGVLAASGGGIYTLSALNTGLGYSAKLSSLTIAAGTQINIPYSNTLVVTGSTLTNNGLIVVNSNTGGALAELLFNSSTLLTGTGTLQLQQPSINALIATGAGVTLTQDIHHSILGYGEVAAALINNNIVNANVAGNTLVLDTNNKTNNLTFEATNGGSLSINGITVSQPVTGSVLAANGSNVQLSSTNVSGGLLSSSGSGYFQVNGSSILSSVTSNATINLPYNQQLTVLGNLVNNGIIVDNSNTGGAVSALNFSGGTLSGTGSIILQQGSNNAQINGSLTQSAGHTIQGYGQINATITNNGIINSNVNGGTLTLAAATTNNNLIESTTSGALINVAGVTITQGAAGQVTAAVGTGITLSSATIAGGAIGGAGIFTVSGTSTLSNLTSSSANINIPYNNTLTVVGNLVDTGNIVVNSNTGGAVAALNFSGGTLSGTGSIFLQQGSNNAQINGSLTQSAGHTIQGYGQINAGVTNSGSIISNIAGQTLTVAGALTNNSLVAANLSGAALTIASVTVTQGVSGQITIAAGATATLTNSNISGGFFNGPGIATVSGISTLNSLTNSATINIPYNQELHITGNLVNNGTIVDNSNTGGAVAALNFSGGTLSGTGSIVLQQGNNNAQINGLLTQSNGHSIVGYGQVNAALTNNGTVNANVNGQTLTLNGITTGIGNFQASGGGTLNVTSSLTITAPGSLIGAGPGSSILISIGGSLIDNGSVAGLPAITDNGIFTIAANPNTGILTRALSSLTLGSTGTTSIPSAANLLNRTLLTTSILTFAGNPGNWGGKLNLGNNDMDVAVGGLSNITSQIAQGYNGGQWNGSAGILSAAAAANPTLLTTLGAIQNNQSGIALFTASNKFDGTTPGVADTLVKYTYYGDTNLDGKVDGSDYSRIDAAYVADKTNPAALTGWFNGDFNYDGIVNGSDYTLIDNVYNRQGAAILSELAVPTAQLANGSSVPEPATLGLLTLTAAGLLGRRRR